MEDQTSVSSRKRGGKKKVVDFELTLARSTLYKEHVFYALEGFCENLVVSQERHHEDIGILGPPSEHFHCYWYVKMLSSIQCIRFAAKIRR